MRILEAWARGIPVVATSAAAAGLDLAGSPGYLQADTADAFVSALREVSDSPARASALVGGGRAALGRWHRPDQIAAALEEVYVDAIARSS